MRAETIERLSAKGHFSSEQALALAEAMDTVIEKAQLVTVPILDSRLGVIDSRFADIDRRFAQINVRFDQVEARLDGLEARVKTGFEAVDIRFKVWGFRIILATVLSQAALGPVGLSALELAKRLLLTVGH